jgi:hypothetical protein
MSATSVFTQPCPACDSPVPISDLRQIGQKIACPWCRFLFRVDIPVEERRPASRAPAPAAPTHRPAALRAPHRGPRAVPFTEVPARTVADGLRFFRRPAHDVWACLCPRCSEALLFDRRRLGSSFWWPFKRRLRCPTCGDLFERQKGFDQPFQGELPVGEEPRRNYVVEVVVGVISAVLAAAVLALFGLKG